MVNWVASPPPTHMRQHKSASDRPGTLPSSSVKCEAAVAYSPFLVSRSATIYG